MFGVIILQSQGTNTSNNTVEGFFSYVNPESEVSVMQSTNVTAELPDINSECFLVKTHETNLHGAPFAQITQALFFDELRKLL